MPLLLLLLAIGWRIHQVRKAREMQAQQQAARQHAHPVVGIATAQVRDIVNTLEGSGTVQAPDQVKLSPKVTGRITYLQVQPGDRVTRGDLLVQIDASQVAAQV